MKEIFIKGKSLFYLLWCIYWGSFSFLKRLLNSQKDVREALANNFNTKDAVEVLLGLISQANSYLMQRGQPNAELLTSVKDYLIRILHIFGVEVVVATKAIIIIITRQ